MSITSLFGLGGTTFSILLHISPLPAMYKGVKEMSIKSITLIYILLGITQSTFWAAYGYDINDYFVFLVNLHQVFWFMIYMNMFFYINRQQSNYLKFNFLMFIVIVAAFSFFTTNMNLYCAAIFACLWQGGTVPTMRQGLEQRDSSFINILLVFTSFLNFFCWVVYGALIHTLLMAFQNTVSCTFMLMNMYIYFWAKGYLKDNAVTTGLKALLRAKEGGKGTADDIEDDYINNDNLIDKRFEMTNK